MEIASNFPHRQETPCKSMRNGRMKRGRLKTKMHFEGAFPVLLSFGSHSYKTKVFASSPQCLDFIFLNIYIWKTDNLKKDNRTISNLNLFINPKTCSIYATRAEAVEDSL